MKNSPTSAANLRLADRLMSEGRLSPEWHATIVSYVGLHGGRIEDAILENEAMPEADLLRYVATMHNTRFVSTEKLYKAVIDPKILQLIPRKLADQHGVLPVMYDGAAHAISVVTADPDNLAMLNEVKIASGVRDVIALVGRPAAVRAAVSRAYHGDASGFAQLIRGEGRMQLTVDRFQSGQASLTSPHAIAVNTVVHGSITDQTPMLARAAEPVPSPAPVAVAPPHPPAPPVAARAPAPAPAPARPPSAPPGRSSTAVMKASENVPTLSSDYLETLNVLVSLLENSRPELRGHSAQSARLMRRVCERMGLTSHQTSAYVVATQLHDIGKAGTYHLTSLNVAEYDGHRAAATKVYNVPERFFQGVSLHADTKSAVNAMYERFDGKGFPVGISGKDIPLGARILAVVDSYFDVTVNPRNPARRILKPAEAMQFLARSRGTVFDPTVLDLVKAEVAGDDLRAKLLSDRQTVLIVDPDPEDSTVLELRLLEAGFEVRSARTYQQAVHELKSQNVSIVVSDVDLDAADAGIALRTAAVGEQWGEKVAVWVIHTRKTDRQLAEIVFELGVDDMVSKPTPPEVFVTKLRQLMERKQSARSAAAPSKGGVSGSLAEMGLPDVVQILWHGRKSCYVRLSTKGGNGDIAFSDGQIVDARFGPKRGEEAFYAMLMLKEGDFKIENEVHKGERTIDVSPEGLLLEGMRRLDEGLI